MSSTRTWDRGRRSRTTISGSTTLVRRRPPSPRRLLALASAFYQEADYSLYGSTLVPGAGRDKEYQSRLLRAAGMGLGGSLQWSMPLTGLVKFVTFGLDLRRVAAHDTLADAQPRGAADGRPREPGSSVLRGPLRRGQLRPRSPLRDPARARGSTAGRTSAAGRTSSPAALTDVRGPEHDPLRPAPLAPLRAQRRRRPARRGLPRVQGPEPPRPLPEQLPADAHDRPEPVPRPRDARRGRRRRRRHGRQVPGTAQPLLQHDRQHHRPQGPRHDADPHRPAPEHRHRAGAGHRVHGGVRDREERLVRRRLRLQRLRRHRQPGRPDRSSASSSPTSPATAAT